MSVQLDQTVVTLDELHKELEAAIENGNLDSTVEKCRVLVGQATDREGLVKAKDFLVQMRTKVRRMGAKHPSRHDLYRLLNTYVVRLTSSTARSSAGKSSGKYEEMHRAAGHRRKALGRHRSFAH